MLIVIALVFLVVGLAAGIAGTARTLRDLPRSNDDFIAW